MFKTNVLLALTLLMLSGLAQAEPRTLAFDGNTLTQHRQGSDEQNGSFVEFTRKDENSRELLVVRSLDHHRVKDEFSDLMADIRKRNPGVKLHMFERSAGNDVAVTYLLTPDKGDASLVLWRLTQVETEVIATIYQLDFAIEAEDVTAKVMNHTAERAFLNLSAIDMKQYLPVRP